MAEEDKTKDYKNLLKNLFSGTALSDNSLVRFLHTENVRLNTLGSLAPGLSSMSDTTTTGSGFYVDDLLRMDPRFMRFTSTPTTTSVPPSGVAVVPFYFQTVHRFFFEMMITIEQKFPESFRLFTNVLSRYYPEHRRNSIKLVLTNFQEFSQFVANTVPQESNVFKQLYKHHLVVQDFLENHYVNYIGYQKTNEHIKFDKFWTFGSFTFTGIVLGEYEKTFDFFYNGQFKTMNEMIEDQFQQYKQFIPASRASIPDARAEFNKLSTQKLVDWLPLNDKISVQDSNYFYDIRSPFKTTYVRPHGVNKPEQEKLQDIFVLLRNMMTQSSVAKKNLDSEPQLFGVWFTFVATIARKELLTLFTQ